MYLKSLQGKNSNVENVSKSRGLIGKICTFEILVQNRKVDVKNVTEWRGPAFDIVCGLWRRVEIEPI